MCGLAGFLEFSQPSASSDDLLAMQRAIAHRGPDDQGIFYVEGLGLAHARLAILDLSSKAHQPMQRDSLILVYNGEIYNFKELRAELMKLGHRFQSESDTEVLLEGYRAWGKDILSKLNGMFAFAIYDAKKRTLFLARDRAGIKPLFYYHDSSHFIFGSEIKAIAKYPYFKKRISCRGLKDYLRFGYTTGEETIFEGCLRLLPGCYLMINADGQLEKGSYWEPNFETDRSLDFEQAKKTLKVILIDEFQKSLISDAPLGVCISGGVDSNILIAILSREIGVKLATFSLSSPQARYNENEKARRVADYLKIPHVSLVLDPKSSQDMLMDTIVHFDEPTADQNILSFRFIAREARRRNIPVLLSGMGGDELFYGYPTVDLMADIESFYRCPYVLRKLIPRSIFLFFNKFYKAIHLGQQKTYLSALANITGRCFFDDEIDDLLRGHDSFSQGQSYFDAFFSKARLPREERIKEIIHCDFRSYLPDNGLKMTDVSCMAEGVEMRVPYLNNTVLDFAFKIPNFVKRQGGQLKALLRALEKEYLPAELTTPLKWGFYPFQKRIWLDQSMTAFMANYLSKERILTQGIFNFDFIKEILFLHKHSRVNVTDKLWNFLIFQIWAERNL